MQDLKQKAIRGGFAGMCAQAASFVIRMGSLMILARLLVPADFGLVGMVTAVTGVLQLFRDFGLSAAAVQRESVSEQQMSTLFWINMLVGALLFLLLLAAAPAIADFYHQPRLVPVTDVLGLGFLINAASVQHVVLLQRQMRFTALSVIGVISLILGSTVAIFGAAAGYGYWALVAMTIAIPFAATTGFWNATRWIPGLPKRQVGIRSMMRFGGTVTLNGLLVYIATNFEKILLGRYWGADAIGLYGRSFQLVNIPTSNLNAAAGEVAFSALSRVRDNPDKLRGYFLKGYSLVLATTIPMTIGCTLFASDVILVLLGPKWQAAVPIFRLLAPTILVFAIANPLSWLLMSLGFVKRLLKMGLVIAPVMILSYVIGLRFGPTGVAFAYSTVMILWIIPLIAWAVHGTAVSFRDVVVTALKPLASGIMAGSLALGVRLAYGHLLSPFPRLTLETTVLLVTFAALLLFVAGQKTLYLDLLRGLKAPSSVEEQSLVSA